MAQNKAQEQLESLLAIEDKAQEDAANVAKMQQARHDFVMQPGDEADFAWPEGVATAVAAGFVLGPVGGLLMGLAQGMLGKREEQAALDQMAAEYNTLALTDDIFSDELERQMALTDNEEDLTQLSAMMANKDAALQMMHSASPELQKRGSELLGQFNTDLNEYTVRQENQRIEAEAADAQLQRDLGKEKYTQHRNLVGDFQKESANFEAQQAAADNILQAVNNGDGASLTAAMATLPLLVNPAAGATTDAEVEMWAGIGGTVDSLIGRVQKELGSGGMTDPTRKEIIGIATQYKRNTLAYQQARESYYGQQVLAEEIPEQYWGQYNKSGRMPVVQQGGFVRGETHREEAAESGDNVPGSTLGAIKDTVTSVIDETSMILGDAVDNYKHEKAWRDEYFKIHGTMPDDPLAPGVPRQ